MTGTKKLIAPLLYVVRPWDWWGWIPWYVRKMWTKIHGYRQKNTVSTVFIKDVTYPTLPVFNTMRLATHHTTKPFSREAKRATIELWKAKVPLKDIRNQLKISESTLRRILAFAKKTPDNPISDRKPGSGRPLKISIATQRTIRKKLLAEPTLTARKLQQLIPELANVSCVFHWSGGIYFADRSCLFTPSVIESIYFGF